MPGPFTAAFLPGVTSALAGAGGAYSKGQMDAMGAFADADYKRSQAEWNRAHAAGYGQSRGAAAQGLQMIQQGLQNDPNFLKTAAGMAALSAMRPGSQVNTGLWDPYYGGQIVDTQLGMHPERERSLTDYNNRLKFLEDRAALENRRYSGMTDLMHDRYADRTLSLGDERDIRNQGLEDRNRYARQGFADRNAAAKELGDIRARIAERKAAEKAAGGGHLSRWDFFERLLGEYERVGPESMHPMDLQALESLIQHERGGEFGAMPLGGQPYNRFSGQIPGTQPPYQDPNAGMWPSFFNFLQGIVPGGQPRPPQPPTVQGATPEGPPRPAPKSPGAFNPSAKPLRVPSAPGTAQAAEPPAPKPATGPGNSEYEQNILGARRAIKELGAATIEKRLKSMQLNPSERLALQEALMMEKGQNQLQ